MAYNEDSSASGHDEPWIQWFCGLKGHEMFCEVERSYIEDGFNLYGLRACVSNFSDCLDLILDRIGPDDSDDSHLTQSACTLYGLIHARYIITAHGLDAMYNKYAAKEFGTCPLVQCAGQPVLPVGLKDEMGADTVKIFCPKCQCVYHPPPVRSRSSHHNNAGAAGVDGAAFGTTFPHLFLMTFSNLVPDRLPSASAYVPRVFGFRVHLSARQRTSTAASSNSASSRVADGKAISKRLPFTRRSGTTIEPVQDAVDRKSVKGEEEASTKEGLAQDKSNDAGNDANSRSSKGTGPSSKQSKGDDAKDDEGSRKSKSSKRGRNADADNSSKGTGNGAVDSNSSSKRRRKADNGNT
mmetsp:Transcript_100945/g.291991  ORF Transcript_100945/g.291991 Transcript_100945/m.291991 type:complete len:353 (-) Transcript_100945:11-1069(-)|eukprot:CAMPEP_0176043440 /NCGR_PEP_ID=MMETSP0120_2-20121206/21557_1 /TAXON_ID=160619 /ORGANISM="Kryptoperidinium foliaceum, Strain CCMP 1326" /LENGTH=352 /DNA_ID=CAMNT_0017376847 /DNA_START=353 /DNA_END=1411 /DNA_ORIENTATION=-